MTSSRAMYTGDLRSAVPSTGVQVLLCNEMLALSNVTSELQVFPMLRAQAATVKE